MPPKIDYPALIDAIDHYDPLGQTHFYFDTQTGEVLMVGDYAEEEARAFDGPDQIDNLDIRLAWYLLWQDGEIGEELPEAEEAAMSERVETYLKRYLPVPAADSHESYQDMVDFAGTVTDPHLTELLDVALTGKGAFRRFKDVLLGYPEERERWFAFKDERLRERVDDWLEAYGLSPEPVETDEANEAGPADDMLPGMQAQQQRPEAAPAEPGTILLNFAHPLTEAHLAKIRELTQETIERTIDLPAQIDPQRPLGPQVMALVNQVGLSPLEWQTRSLLVNPPSLNFIAVTLLAELHGRCGYFPACLRLRPVPDSLPPRYEVAEIINLQIMRDQARHKRRDEG